MLSLGEAPDKSRRNNAFRGGSFAAALLGLTLAAGCAAPKASDQSQIVNCSERNQLFHYEPQYKSGTEPITSLETLKTETRTKIIQLLTRAEAAGGIIAFSDEQLPYSVIIEDEALTFVYRDSGANTKGISFKPNGQIANGALVCQDGGSLFANGTYNLISTLDTKTAGYDAASK